MTEKLLKKEKMHLIKIEQVKFPDKENPQEEVVKFKYVFLTPENSVRTGFLDQEMFRDFLEPAGEYEESHAMLYFWEGREWQGAMKFKLTDLTPKPVV